MASTYYTPPYKLIIQHQFFLAHFCSKPSLQLKKDNCRGAVMYSYVEILSTGTKTYRMPLEEQAMNTGMFLE